MRQMQTLGQDGGNGRVMSETSQPTVATPTTKEIPYDYVATFRLEGRRGNRVQDVINISVDGAFVAVAIGYSFIPAPLPDRATDVAAVGGVVRTTQLIGTLAGDIFTDPRMLVECLLVRLCGIDFKYSIIDSSTGRELQNKAIHNIAGLGESTGQRPFRPMAKPMLFMPRSTIRIEIEEISEGPLYGHDELNQAGQPTGRRIEAELFIVLHGYKILGYGTSLP